MKAAILRKADLEPKKKQREAIPSGLGGGGAGGGVPLFLRRTAVGPTQTSASAQAPRAAIHPTMPGFLATTAIQTFSAASLNVSSPHDPAEREAAATAKMIMRAAVPESPSSSVRTGNNGTSRQVAKTSAPVVLKKREIDAEKIQFRAAGPPNIDSNVATSIQNGMSLGSPLPPAVRGFMEPRFRADFRNVRIHTGHHAARLNRRLSAQAFATGNHIFFGKDRFQPESEEGKELIAHELTHTIQQGATVQRSADVSDKQHSPTQVQRQEEGEEDQGTIVNYFAREANEIPGFRMFTIVLGVNPITGSKVQRNAANILRAIIEILPMGKLITDALDNSGVFDKAGAFVERQLATLTIAGDTIIQAVKDFMAGLGLLDFAHPGNLWERAKHIFTDPIDHLVSFVEGLVSDIVELVKQAILRPIAKLAEGTAGYDLLKAVLGKDPITGDTVEPTAENVIGPFMKLIGEEAIWENMQQAKAVPRAWAWFQKALSGVKGFITQIPELFVSAFKALQLEDIILVPKAFEKLKNVFGGFLEQFGTWAGNTIWNLLEIIFDVVSPGALGYIKKTGAALKNILKNPLPFVGNLVKSAKLGFQNFAHNFLTHLKAGLIDWLTGSLPGVYIPKAISLGEIVKFAFSVLELTWEHVRQKLVKTVGEPAVKAMETGFDIVVTLVTQGPAAAWDKIKDQLANLKDLVIGGITDFVVEMVVQKAVPKLVAMFIPGAGFISAIVSIYDTIMVFVNKISQIAQVVSGFIDSIVVIAGGAIGAAATRVETTLAGVLSLAINFLTGFAGLGKVADKVMGVINKVRAPIDKALDWLINWIVTMAKKLFAKVFGRKDEKGATGDVREQAGKALLAQLKTERKKAEVDVIMKSVLAEFRDQGLKRLELGQKTETGEYIVFAEASPNSALLKLTPKRRKVRMTVSLKLTGSEPLLEGVTTKLGKHIRYVNGEKKETALPAPLKPVEGKSVMGGLLVPPEPESDEVKLVTWNTGDIDPRVLSNATHAERQFTSWFESQPEKWRRRVVSIEAQINYSPCTSCAADLSRIAALAPALQNAALTWEQPYAEGPLATTSASLSSIRMWKIIPSSVSGEKEAELVAEK
jgi:hypothetical protein